MIEATRTLARALADDNRLRALAALRGGELCLCQLVELLGLAPSTVSRHMSELRRAGLVAARKDGRWVHYRLEASGPAAGALDWTLRGLAHDPCVRADARRLARIRRRDPSELCRSQCR